MDTGCKIKRLRLDKNIKQEDLARHLKISQSTLSKIESGLLAVSVDKLVEIANYAQTSLTNLLPGEINGLQIISINLKT